jgi:hypothetical protein
MRKIQKISIVAGTVGVLMAGGIAFAAWTSTGSGTGTVQAGTEQGLTVDASDVGTLYPTGTVDIVVSITNDNPYNVTLDSITWDSVESDDANCDTSSVTSTDDATASDAIAAGDTITRTFVVSMDDDADNDCQGDLFTLAYTAVGHSSN